MINLRMKLIGIISIFVFLFANVVVAAPEAPLPSMPAIPASEELDLYILESYNRSAGNSYLYGVDEGDFEADKATSLDATPIGDWHNILSVAVNWDTGIVFAVFDAEGDSVLATVDMDTGDIVKIGDLSENIQSIAFDKDGSLYGMSSVEDASLYLINEVNVGITFIENYDYNHRGIALSYDIENELMYYVDGVDMYTIDLNNPSEPTMVYEGIGDFGDDINDLVNIDGENFYIVEDSYVVYNVNINTEEIVEVVDTDTLNYYYYIGGMFFYPSVTGLVIDSKYPIHGSNTADNNDNLSIQFTEDAVFGNGNIGIYKYDDESLIEELDGMSDRITGWNTSNLVIDWEQELSFDTKYFVLIEESFINDFAGFDVKDDWNFTTRPDGNEFGFEDSFDTENFVDKDETTAFLDNEDTSFSLAGFSGVWTNADRSTLGKEDIQNNMNDRGYDPKITLDSDGNQMVVWEEDGDIMFTMWDGDDWVTMSDVAGKEDISTTVSMCSDEGGDGEPGGEPGDIGMLDNLLRLLGVHNALAFTMEGPIDEANDGCRQASQPQIFVDNDGNPVVAWIGIQEEIPDVQEDAVDIFVRKWSGDAWVTMGGIIDSDRIFSDNLPMWNYEFNMVLSSGGHPMIVTKIDNGEGFEVGYTEWTGSEWNGKMSSPASYDQMNFGGSPIQIQLARDSNNNPMITYVDNADMRSIHFAHWNGGSWSSMDGGTDNDELENWMSNGIPQLKVDSNNNPVVAYVINAEGIIRLGVQTWDEGSWESRHMNVGYTEIVRLNLDNEDNPIVSWVDEQQNIHLTRLDSLAWEKMDGTIGYDVVDETGKQVQYMDMELTSDNRPMIVWSELEWSSTHFKMWNGSSWTGGDGESTESDSLSGNVETLNLDIVINSNDEPSVVWGENWGDQDIHFSILPTEIISPAVVQSDKINGSIADIIKATLIADEELEGESRIEYYLSIDGGATWIQVNSGEELIFDIKGDNLRWKAILYKGSVPVLDGVRVEYESQSIMPPTPGDNTVIKTILECECYEVGSEESTHSDTTSFLYSNNNQVTWEYVLMPDSDKKDCNVTDIKMIDEEQVTTEWSQPQSVYEVSTNWPSADNTINNDVVTGDVYTYDTEAAYAIYDMSESKQIQKMRAYIDSSSDDLPKIDIYISDDVNNMGSALISDWDINTPDSWEESIDIDEFGRYIKYVFNHDIVLPSWTDITDISHWNAFHPAGAGASPLNGTWDGVKYIGQKTYEFSLELITPDVITASDKLRFELNHDGDDVNVIIWQWNAAGTNLEMWQTQVISSTGGEIDLTGMDRNLGSVRFQTANGTILEVLKIERIPNIATSIDAQVNEISVLTTETQVPDNTGSDFTYKTKPDPSCDSPVTPPIDPEDPEEEKECKTDNIKEITKDSVTLRVEVDEEYADEKIKFKVEVENLYTNEKETIKLTDKPSDSGRVTLEIDNLEEDTQYRFKVSYQEDDSYEYCPHSKTATTEKTTLGPTKEIVNPECGESSKTYTEDESEFTGDFCQTGEVLNIPEFPNQGESSSWTCTNDDEEITCSASREEKEIVTPPVVQGGSDPEPPAQEVTDPPVQEPTKEQQKEKQYQAAAVVGLTTGTLIALASTTIPLFTTIPMAATDIFIMPFLGILARRKNEQNWGTVFEQTTKQPLPGVKLVLTDIEGFEIETTYSDQHGRFGFLTTNGTYLIHPEKPKYEEDLTHNHDSLYGDVYTGEALTIEENKVLATNIAMNALNINWNEYADKKVKSYTGTFSAIKKWSFIILFYVGFIATAAITYLYPSTLNYIFLSLYMALFIYDNFIKQKKYGTVTKHDKNPVPFAVVSLHNKETNQKTGFAVTDAIGRYYLLAENGDYNMKVKGQPISGQPFEKQGNINVRKGLA
ncbi:MAG: Ig-like domain-containing protein [Candidatus Moraniibacteriota bacterium]